MKQLSDPTSRNPANYPVMIFKHSILVRVVIGACLMPLVVLAAITDSDLNRVTQLIQQGKTARAKAEITILLDDNPNDANATKLRKLLDSLSSSEANTQKSSDQTSGPSAKETIEWIQSHLNKLSSTGHLNDFSLVRQENVSAVDLNNARLTFWIYVQVNMSNSKPFCTWRKISFDLSEVLGETRVAKSEASNLNIKSLEILFHSRLNKITSLKSVLKDLPASPHEEEAIAELKRSVEQGEGKEERISEFSIPVTAEGAERFKKAFDHLIKLHGGGKAEAF